MRTKTLLLAAALSVAAVASSMAQSNVYSLNVVGYVNVTVPVNKYQIVSTPLNFTGPGGNNITNVIGGTIEDGTTVIPFSGGTFQDPETYVVGFGWFPGTTVLNPGAGYFVKTPSGGSPSTLTFVGEVLQGNQTNALISGYTLVGSQVPQSVPVGDMSTSQATTMHFPAADSDNILRYSVAAQNYADPITYVAGYGWFDPALGGGPVEGPSPAVAEGFFVQKTSATNWVRNFTIP